MGTLQGLSGIPSQALVTREARASQYRSLMVDVLDRASTNDIRYAIKKGLPVGSDRFKADIEKHLGQRLGTGNVGRPTKNYLDPTALFPFSHRNLLAAQIRLFPSPLVEQTRWSCDRRTRHQLPVCLLAIRRRPGPWGIPCLARTAE